MQVSFRIFGNIIKIPFFFSKIRRNKNTQNGKHRFQIALLQIPLFFYTWWDKAQGLLPDMQSSTDEAAKKPSQFAVSICQQQTPVSFL